MGRQISGGQPCDQRDAVFDDPGYIALLQSASVRLAEASW